MSQLPGENWKPVLTAITDANLDVEDLADCIAGGWQSVSNYFKNDLEYELKDVMAQQFYNLACEKVTSKITSFAVAIQGPAEDLSIKLDILMSREDDTVRTGKQHSYLSQKRNFSSVPKRKKKAAVSAIKEPK